MKGISAHFAIACIKGATRLGIDPTALFDYAEIDTANLNDPTATVSHQQLATLIKTVWKWTDDEFMGLGVNRCRLGYFRLLTTNQIRASRLLASLNYCEEHYRVTRDDAVFKLEYHGEQVRLIHDIQCQPGDNDHLLNEYYLLAWQRYLSWIIGVHIDITETTFSYPKPTHGHLYNDIFPGEFKFDQPYCSFAFSTSYLRYPLKRSAQDVSRYVSRLPLPLFFAPDVDRHFSTKIKNLLHESPIRKLPNLSGAAQLLDMNPRTLHRKLREEGTHFQRIKDLYRYEQAIDCLTLQAMNVSDASEFLGFSESAAFCHFFKKVAGITPSKYVQLH